MLGWGNMPVNITRDARYVQRILNWETWGLGFSSLMQVEQSSNLNSRQESIILFSILFPLQVMQIASLRRRKVLEEKTLVTQATSQGPTHPSTETFMTKDQLLESEILWGSIQYHFWILATLYLNIFNESWCINMLVYTPTNKQ